MRDGAVTQSPTLTSHMSEHVAAMHTQAPSASCKAPAVDRWARRPCYVQDLVWVDNKPPLVTLAVWTESAPSLPSPPANELSNEVALKTIHENPHLFKIVLTVSNSYSNRTPARGHALEISVK